ELDQHGAGQHDLLGTRLPQITMDCQLEPADRSATDGMVITHRVAEPFRADLVQALHRPPEPGAHQLLSRTSAKPSAVAVISLPASSAFSVDAATISPSSKPTAAPAVSPSAAGRRQPPVALPAN